MKKMLSVVAVVLCLLYIPHLAIAVADELWEDSAVELWAFEQRYGSYEHWPIALKRSLIVFLRWQNMIEETPDYIILMTEGSAASMASRDAHILADRIVCDTIGRPLHEITTFTITEAVWGNQAFWNDSQRSFWDELEAEVMINIPSERLTTSDYDKNSFDAALAVAKHENIIAFSLDADYFTDHTVINQVQYISPINHHVCWFITLEKQVDIDSRNIRYFWASIDTVTETCMSDNQLGLLSPQERVKRLQQRIAHDSDTPLRMIVKQFYFDQATQGYYRFADYPLVTKAQFSIEISPLIRQAIELNSEYIFDDERAIASFEYGLPNDKNLPEQEAVSIARNYAVAEWGEQNYLYMFSYFDISNPNKWLWRIYFDTHGGIGDPDYCVEVDAITGEMVSVTYLDFAKMRYLDRRMHMQ